MTTERAVNLLKYGCRMPDFCDAFSDIDEACEIACHAIQEKIERENPKPLTFDELMNMKGEPVWLYDYGIYHWALVSGEMDYIGLNGEKYKAVNFVFESDSSYPMATLPLDTMGELWVAYKYKPMKV